jgi:hypothetical protein
MPDLKILKINDSFIKSLRDIGTSLKQLHSLFVNIYK